ncbi:MAG: hypothetical protein NTV37_09895 [Proteobacteria bacterium]|nr:hypothetical protein [Pseudomonadota bacterium]
MTVSNVSQIALDERLPLALSEMALAHPIGDKVHATQQGVNQRPTITIFSIQQLSAHRYLRIPSLHRADY